MMNRSKVTRINTYACGLCVLISLVVPIAWLSMRCVEPRLTLAPSNQHDELVKRRIWVPFAAAYAAATGSKPIRKIRRHEHLEPFEIEEARLAWKTFLQTIAATPFSAFRGRGIVISGASFQLNSAFACVKMLRQYGCELPVELWISSGRGEMPSAREAQLFLELDVEIRDADAVALTFPEMKRQVHMKQGDSKPYILKQIALLSARCRECLLLDADNIPLRNPEYLFETKEYLSTGHLLWPDLWRMPRQQADIRQIFELPFGGNVTLRDEQTVESGQMVVDKGKAWYTLVLATFIQLQTEFYDLLMRELHNIGGVGDKHTFLLGCLASQSRCHMIPHPVASGGNMVGDQFCGTTMLQHDLEGRPLFVHANLDKHGLQRRTVRAAEWSEAMRWSDLVQVPSGDGLGIQCGRIAACGVASRVTIDSPTRSYTLRNATSFDFERLRFHLFRDFDRMAKNCKAR